MKYTIDSSIIIKAPIDIVWNHFMDFDTHPQWNSFLRIEAGEKSVGKTIAVDFLKDGKASMTMKPRVVKISQEEAFEWQGHLFIKGIFDGHHQFHFRDLGDGTTELRQFENFNGILIRFLIKSVMEPTKVQFEQMNQDFKSYIESL